MEDTTNTTFEVISIDAVGPLGVYKAFCDILTTQMSVVSVTAAALKNVSVRVGAAAPVATLSPTSAATATMSSVLTAPCATARPPSDVNRRFRTHGSLNSKTQQWLRLINAGTNMTVIWPRVIQ
uniref:Uncharacterized protein n=1 Tax=Glossina morsitans morsitans TaxID=37546 RepID=A0A1B0FAZ7_GLOMM